MLKHTRTSISPDIIITITVVTITTTFLHALPCEQSRAVEMFGTFLNVGAEALQEVNST
jgi:hypothetical protein